jgi:hypothetical protein
MKLLKKADYISELYHTLMDNYFTVVPLATTLYELENFVTEAMLKTENSY